jgi:hypothetical protein
MRVLEMVSFVPHTPHHPLHCSQHAKALLVKLKTKHPERVFPHTVFSARTITVHFTTPRKYNCMSTELGNTEDRFPSLLSPKTLHTQRIKLLAVLVVVLSRRGK